MTSLTRVWIYSFIAKATSMKTQNLEQFKFTNELLKRRRFAIFNIIQLYLF